jgi:hypothetical protein
MAIPKTTPIRIRYVARGTAPVELGSGEIDIMGIITMTAPAPGQADYLAETLGELNAREDVILKGLPLPPQAPVAAVPDDGPADEEAGDEDAATPGARALPEPEPPVEPHPSPSKQKIRRGSSRFLAALKDYGHRVYGLDLDFDERAFVLDALFGTDSALPSPPESTAGKIALPPD